MSLMNYIVRAFNARPWGMPLPPNWAGLAAFGLLGFEEPGFWILGAGLELAYLLMVGTNRRFQRLVDGETALSQQQTAAQKLAAVLGKLSPADRGRYDALEARCRSILETHGQGEVAAQWEGLQRLVQVYLRLLTTKGTISAALDSGAARAIDVQIKDVSARLKGATSPELHHSLADQLAILAERKKRQGEARDKLAYIDAELSRIEQQVELIRESLLVNADPQALSTRIDSIAETLNETSGWIKEQQALYGQTEELLSEPPPIALSAQRQSQ
jgi:hypothetical protein